MNRKLLRIALVAALACAGNLVYAQFNGLAAADAYTCKTGGCDDAGQCGTSCGCFPNPFDKDPAPGICTN